jgi:hypothetical protein
MSDRDVFINRAVSSAADSVFVDRCFPRRDKRDFLDLRDLDFLDDFVRRELLDIDPPDTEKGDSSVVIVCVPAVESSNELDLKVDDSRISRFRPSRLEVGRFGACSR